jgi:peptidyl-dipeptidase Dcp
MLMHLNTSRERNFDKEVATKQKTYFLKGTEHPMTLYKLFRGQEPKPDALLKKRAGLL